jgi:hypothetical protein
MWPTSMKILVQNIMYYGMHKNEKIW